MFQLQVGILWDPRLVFEACGFRSTGVWGQGTSQDDTFECQIMQFKYIQAAFFTFRIYRVPVLHSCTKFNLHAILMVSSQQVGPTRSRF